MQTNHTLLVRYYKSSHPSDNTLKGTVSLLTISVVIWKFMLVTGTGAEDSMEMITTSTSGRDGGEL